MDKIEKLNFQFQDYNDVLEVDFEGGCIQIFQHDGKFVVSGVDENQKFKIEKEITSIYDALDEANKWWFEKNKVTFDKNGRVVIRNESGEVIGRQG